MELQNNILTTKKPKMTNEEFIKYLKDNFNISLNKGQEECVLNICGPILTVAVPGAGKTFSTCVRLFNTIWNYGVDPKKILAVTFSKASARDMSKKFNDMFGNVLGKERMVDFSTIHSFAYKIVKDYQRKYNLHFDLLEGNTKRRLFEQIYKNICNDTITDDVYESITGQISYCKNRLMPIKEIQYMNGEIHNKFYDLYIAYEDYKKNNNLLDYDDMLTLAYEYLIEDNSLYKKYNTMFEHIVVDEGQDTSTVQFEIIRLISGESANICMVGDDDQTIYEWRSADVDNFLYFDKYYPNVKKVFMEQNYRSTKKIIKVSNDFIKKNDKRYDKNMFTENEEGENISVIECDEYVSQVEFIVDKLRNVTNFRDHAIIFRNNMSAFTIAKVLDKYNIPFYIRDYKESFFIHWILKDISNFLNVARYPKDYKSFERIALKMQRYISKKMLYYISKDNESGKDVFEKLLTYPDLKKFQKDNIITLRQEFLRLKTKNIRYAINYICNELGYYDYLETMSEKLGFSLDSLKERIFVLKELSLSSEDIYDFEDNLCRFQEVLNTSTSNYGTNAVVLTTAHSSKGLEWKNVYMVDLNDGVFPSYKAIAEAKEGNYQLMEAERKLYYVSITRAKERLWLLHSKTRNGNIIQPSLFTKEVVEVAARYKCCDVKSYSKHKNENKVALFNINTEEFINNFNTSNTSYSTQTSILESKEKKTKKSDNKSNKAYVGSKIVHSSLGEGIITKILDSYIEVKFNSGETKKINLDICLKKNLITIG